MQLLVIVSTIIGVCCLIPVHGDEKHETTYSYHLTHPDETSSFNLKGSQKFQQQSAPSQKYKSVDLSNTGSCFCQGKNPYDLCSDGNNFVVDPSYDGYPADFCHPDIYGDNYCVANTWCIDLEICDANDSCDHVSVGSSPTDLSTKGYKCMNICGPKRCRKKYNRNDCIFIVHFSFFLSFF